MKKMEAINIQLEKYIFYLMVHVIASATGDRAILILFILDDIVGFVP